MSTHSCAVEAGIGMGVSVHFIALAQNLVYVRNDIGCNQSSWWVIYADFVY
ncbi:hypothetical protein [Snodgrassella sp. ESL0253]|uniref:hypothetical protein n=1 Tax=Snodgrassella sp. ESL0253 TaxID=2705031 RepID=UPI001583FE8C|nr:hypothetical protein [Snodgrassella sp. ESL0253]NUE67025.1 hypothetical protein [Snodgrassella sp. ESL0253]